MNKENKTENIIFKQKGIIDLDKYLFDGYISEVDDGVFISHIKSKFQGRGNFSKLLRELMNKYNWIKVPTPSNQMIKILTEKGFIMKQEFFPEPFNEIGIIMFWEKE